MKESVESTNRKLIRPSLSEVKETFVQHKEPKEVFVPHKRPVANQQQAPQQNHQQRANRFVPPDQTNAENFYYVKQMQNHTPMVLVLQDGETLHGKIEWYDRTCLKVSRDSAPNLLVYKTAIKYIYKEGDKGSKAASNGSVKPNGSA
jgi:sRNA-binding regulator protein Hfq